MRLFSPIMTDDTDQSTLPPELVDEVTRTFNATMQALRREILQMPDWMPPKVWVQYNIRLDHRLSQREGWLEYTGYQAALSDYFMDELCKQLTILKGTRIGWSLFIASIAMYIAKYLKKTVTISQPTDGDAAAFYKEVIEPMIACCKPKVEDGEDEDESKWLVNQRLPGTWNLMQFKEGGCIRLIGATSDDNFRRFDSPFNFMDEYSAEGYAPSKGSQGSKKSLFAERGGAHWRTMIGVGSSPLSKDDCRTYGEYLNSDKRLPWVTCPHCDQQQVMDWGDRDSPSGFKWTCDETTGFVDHAWYQCVSGCRITDMDKIALDQSLEYIPSSVSTTPGHYGLHIPQWLMIGGQANYKDICQRWLNSQGDPEQLKTFTNNVRATVWDEYTTSAMEAKAVSNLLKPYPAEVPDDVVVLTAGIDTQDNKEGTVLERQSSREVSVVGWTALGQMRVIGHWVVLGEPGDHEADNALQALLGRPFHKRDGKPWFIQAAAHDFGNNSGYADAIRRFCNNFAPSRNIWAIKGNSHRKDFIWPKGRSKSTSGTTYYTIDSHNARDGVFKLLQLVGDKAPMFPLSLGTGYLDMLMCQERYRKGGLWHWRDKKGHRPEEQWMCLAYAYAALIGLQTSYKKWKHLNLAADSLKVPSISFDPETGEIGYEGVDRSAMAGIETADVEQPRVKPTARKEQNKNTAPAQPMAAASTGGEQRVRKRRRGGIIR